MRIGFYGDDFTGSIDALLQFRRAGLSGVLVTDPSLVPGAADDHDVVGIAGIARSLPTGSLEAEVRPALAALLATGVDVVQYKACSTVDSSPAIGSLGRVVELARGLVGPAPVPVLFAQPDFGRYTVFSTHFARDGADIYRLDRHPTMANHPSTPATEADLREILRRQTDLGVGAVQWPAVRDEDVGAALAGSIPIVVCDGFSDEHLDAVGRAVLAAAGDGPRFVLGAGGLSLGIGRAASRNRDQDALDADVAPAEAGTVVLSGSMSPLTRGQIEAARHAGWAIVDLFADDASERAARLHASGRDLIVSSSPSAPPPGRRPAEARDVVEGLAAIGDACLRRDPRTRIVLCGGDTSGRVLRRWGCERLEIGGRPWGNVVLCRARGGRRHLAAVEVVLKGGQTGHLELFDDIAHGRPRPDHNQGSTTMTEATSIAIGVPR